ncbi:MAG: hypothetical protein HOA81_05690, partial [Opitutales bacterium]|nr:hypothetical protein [Opitutales bacterium]
MKTPIDRRRFLRAIGMTLALPVLESLPVAASAISAGRKLGPAKRLVCVGANLGLHAGSFYPKESGSDYGVTPLLKPLMQH